MTHDIYLDLRSNNKIKIKELFFSYQGGLELGMTYSVASFKVFFF